MEVLGFGKTTVAALDAARVVAREITQGDPRPWLEANQSYAVEQMPNGLEVRCTLSLELVETIGGDR